VKGDKKKCGKKITQAGGALGAHFVGIEGGRAPQVSLWSRDDSMGPEERQQLARNRWTPEGKGVAQDH